MKSLLTVSAAVAAFAAPAAAQIIPGDPDLGGSPEAAAQLAQLVESGVVANMNTIQNLEGPAGPATYVRSRIGLHEVTPEELPGVEGYHFRTSFVEVGAGDVVPVHSHAGRPAIALILEGEVWHHGSDNQSYLLETGSANPSAGGIAEWWYNPGEDAAKIWIVDLCGPSHGCSEEDLGEVMDLGGPDAGPVAAAPEGEGPSAAEVLLTVPLAPEFPEAAEAIDDRQLRVRRIEWAPGRIVPPHSHVGRPTFIWIEQGDFTFYSHDGQRVIEEGSVVIERGEVEHAWKNNGDETVVLYAVDIVDPE
jgi:quercetin dioxygenase-like cupin family protein